MPNHPLNRPLHRCFRLLCFFALLPPAAATAENQLSDAADWTITRNEWRRPFAADELHVTNRYGDVRIRVHELDQIYALAHIQRHREDPRQAVIALDEKATPPAIFVRYDPDPVVEAPPKWQRRRVDLTLFIPAATKLSVTTDAGLAEVRGTRRPLEVTTETGEARLRIAGPATVHSRHGAVQVFFLAGDWPGASVIETVTGPIEVTLADGLSAEVALATHGRITSDYSLLIERRPGSDYKQARAWPGGLAAADEIRQNGLILTSDRGAIALLASTVKTEQGNLNVDSRKDLNDKR